MKSQSWSTAPWRLCQGLLVAVIACALASSPAWAQKPSKPPPEPDLPGIVYFVDAGWVCSMDSNGNNVVQYWPYRTDWGGTRNLADPIVPSFGTHGGSRWFIALDSNTGELVARAEAGTDYVVLLEPAQIEAGTMDQVLWLPGDSGISWLVWDSTGDLRMHTGIYTVPVTFDENGVPTLGEIQLALDLTPWAEGCEHSSYAYGGYDWAPDASAVVISMGQDGALPDLWIAPLGSAAEPLLPDDEWAMDPKWSPDGGKIAYRYFVMNSPTSKSYFIETINLESGVQTILAETSFNPSIGSKTSRYVRYPAWAPTGDHLVYQHLTVRLAGADLKVDAEIHRIAADGSSDKVIRKSGTPFAWRWCE
jgi:hypothetical protein